MDVQTVITAMLTSATVSGAILYFLKRTLDRAVDLQYERFLERFKSDLAEQTRRSAAVYDRQVGALEELVGIVYRLRGISRQIVSSGDDWPEPLLEEFFQRMAEFEELVGGKRVLFTRSHLVALHDLRNIQGTLTMAQVQLEALPASEDDDKRSKYQSIMRQAWGRLDDSYSALLSLVQVRLGVLEHEASVARTRGE